MNQGNLFEPPPPPDHVEVCTCCGRAIVVEHHDGTVISSEYQSARGECWECARRA